MSNIVPKGHEGNFHEKGREVNYVNDPRSRYGCIRKNGTNQMATLDSELVDDDHFVPEGITPGLR